VGFSEKSTRVLEVAHTSQYRVGILGHQSKSFIVGLVRHDPSVIGIDGDLGVHTRRGEVGEPRHRRAPQKDGFEL
jgi:hypothetical protein